MLLLLRCTVTHKNLKLIHVGCSICSQKKRNFFLFFFTQFIGIYVDQLYSFCLSLHFTCFAHLLFIIQFWQPKLYSQDLLSCDEFQVYLVYIPMSQWLIHKHTTDLFAVLFEPIAIVKYAPF